MQALRYPSGFCHLLWRRHSRGYITGMEFMALLPTTDNLWKTLETSPCKIPVDSKISSCYLNLRKANSYCVDGIIDIYIPDIKYSSSDMAKSFLSPLTSFLPPVIKISGDNCDIFVWIFIWGNESISYRFLMRQFATPIELHCWMLNYSELFKQWVDKEFIIFRRPERIGHTATRISPASDCVLCWICWTISRYTAWRVSHVR